jgi:cytochrome c553
MKILLSTVLATFLFVGCSDNNEKKTEEAAQSVKETTLKSVSKVEEVVKDTAEVTKEVAEATVEVSKEIATEVKDTTEVAVEKTQESVKEVAQEVEKATEIARDGKTIYKACSGCHGVSAETPALGKSQVIKGWEVAKIEKALTGYKDGSYGGTMKGVMKGQANKLSEADIKAVAEYISKL